MTSEPAHMNPARSFQGLILTLQRYWAEQGCVILQPYDMEVGAGTFHPATTLRARFGDKVSLRVIAPSRPGLVARLLGRRSFGDDTLLDPAEFLGTLEERAAWTRIGI